MAKYKVAVATNDGVNVNVHFGHAAAFDIYEVDEASGKYEKVEVRLKPEHCDGSCGDGTCGQREVQHSSMYAAAKNLADLDYVLCEQLGPQAHQRSHCKNQHLQKQNRRTRITIQIKSQRLK